MVNRRNAEKKNYFGGGGGNIANFSAYEFAGDDLRAETFDRNSLAKFGIKRTGKKPAHHRQPIDKYAFLECFSRGTTTQQNVSGSDVIDVDVTDSGSGNRSRGRCMTTSAGSISNDHPSSFLKHQGLEYSSCSKCCAPGSQKPGGYTTGEKNNKVLYVDSDEEGQMDLLSSNYFNRAGNEGSLKKEASEYGAKNNDCEAVVIVSPQYVKYGNMHYIRCHLTFSRRCIRLDGSPLCEKKRTICHEWSTCDILKIEYQQCESVKANIVNLQLKSKDIYVPDVGYLNSGSEGLEFIVLDDPQWCETLKEIKSLDLKYTTAWETITSEYYSDESFEDIIYPDGDHDAIFISKRDIKRLQPRIFINDTIIDFYIKYLVNKTHPEEQHRFHFFNAFFFQKLRDMGRDLSQTVEGGDAFRRVRKWTRNINIFEKDYIFIPVNFSLHWSLIVICHPGEVANLTGKGMDGSSKVPCILHMDSMRGSHEGLEDLIRSYLLEEWKERGNKQEENISEKFTNMDFIALQLPQQENSFDCGLFLLHYAELFLEQALKLSATKYVNVLNRDWFLAAEVSFKKRDHIRKLIHKIAKDNAVSKDPRTARNIESVDSSPDSVQQYDVKESLRQQSKLGLKNSSVTEECEPLVPINQYNNMSQGTLGNRDTSSSYVYDGNDEPMSPRHPPISLTTGKVECSRETSSRRRCAIDVQNEGDCVSDVASSTERQQKRYAANSSMAIEDLETCVVEDSEDESETGSIIIIRTVITKKLR